MANNYTKTMRDALNEARSFRDTTEGGPGSGPQKGGKKFSSSEIKKAYGILNDPRYKQGNYTGAAKAINKLAPGLADHPDVKNAMKRANEESQITEKKANFLRLTFANNQTVKKVDRWVYNNLGHANQGFMSMIPDENGKSIEWEDIDDADGLMTKLKRAGFSFKVDMRENLDLPATGDTTTSNASQEVEQVDEARFSQSQIDQLKKQFGPLKDKGEKNAVQMDKLAKMMGKYSPDHLLQLSTLDIPMVSKVAKALLAKKDSRFSEETELDEASRLRPTKGLYSMAQMKQQVARTEKAFNEFKQHCDFIFQMDRDVGPSMSDNSGKYFDVYSDLDDANKLIKKALADAKKIT